MIRAYISPQSSEAKVCTTHHTIQCSEPFVPSLPVFGRPKARETYIGCEKKPVQKTDAVHHQTSAISKVAEHCAVTCTREGRESHWRPAEYLTCTASLQRPVCEPSPAIASEVMQAQANFDTHCIDFLRYLHGRYMAACASPPQLLAAGFKMLLTSEIGDIEAVGTYTGIMLCKPSNNGFCLRLCMEFVLLPRFNMRPFSLQASSFPEILGSASHADRDEQTCASVCLLDGLLLYLFPSTHSV